MTVFRFVVPARTTSVLVWSLAGAVLADELQFAAALQLPPAEPFQV
jgi:hypothetical protein